MDTYIYIYIYIYIYMYIYIIIKKCIYRAGPTATSLGTPAFSREASSPGPLLITAASLVCWPKTVARRWCAECCDGRWCAERNVTIFCTA